MTISSQEVICVATDVEEVYIACKKTLEKHYGPVELTIRGSSVAGLFSGENASDLDLQARLKFAHLTDSHQIAREGFNLKWKLLESIRNIVLQKIVPEKHAALRAVSLDAFNFKDTNVLSALHDQGPCNIHQVRIGEIEISCFVEANPSKQAQRNFDFNSGALEIVLNEKGEVILQSPCENIEATIQQITAKELRCIRPQEISRRALSRYFSKLFFSGYVDPSKDLLSTFLEITKSQCKKEDPLDIAQEIIKELELVFKEKKSPLWMLYLSLLLAQDEHPVMQEVAKNLKTPLCEILERQEHPLALQIRGWLANESYEVIAWFLIMQASSIQVTTYRENSCIQICISNPYPCYLLIPEETFLKNFSAKGMAVFLKEGAKVALVQELNQDTKEFLQRALAKHIKHPEFFSAFIGLAHKFNLKTPPSCAAVFLHWFHKLSPRSKDQLEFARVAHVMPHLQADQDLDFAASLALFKMVKKYVLEHDINCFDQAINPGFMLACCAHLVKDKEFDQLLSEDQHQILTFMERFQQQYFATDRKDKKHFKAILSATLYLHKQQRLGWNEVFIATRHCLDEGYQEEGFKLLKMLILKGPPELKPSIQQILANWALHKPSTFVKFVQQYAEASKECKEFFQACLQENHIQLLTCLRGETLTSYCEVLQKIGSFAFLIEVAKTSETAVVSGCESACLVLQVIMTSTGCSLLDLIDFDGMNQESFVQANALDIVQAAIMQDFPLRQKMFKLALVHQQIPLARGHLEFFLQENSETALEMIALLPYETFNHFSLVEMLNLSTAFSKHGFSYQDSPMMKIFIDKLLKLLDQRCDLAIEQPLLINERQLIQVFHKKYMLLTSLHPAWPKVWDLILPMSKELKLKDWMQEVMLLDMLEHIKLTPMKPLFLHLEVSFEFIEKLAQGMHELFRRVDPGERKDLQSMLFNFIELAKSSFWELDLKHYKHNSAAMEQFKAFLGYFLTLAQRGEPGEDLVQLLLLSLKGMSHFCSAEIRGSEVISLFVEIMETQVVKHQKYFETNGRYQQLLVSLMHKAVHDEDLEQALHVFCLYRQYCSPDITQKSLLKQENSVLDLSSTSLDALCKELIKSIEGHVLDAGAEDFKGRVAILNFYNCFLSDLLLSVEEALTQADPTAKVMLVAKRGRILGYVKDQLERISKLHSFEYFFSAKHLLKFKRHFSEEARAQITKKLLKVTAEFLKSKNPLTSADDTRLVVFTLSQMRDWVDIEELAQGSFHHEVLEFLERLRPFLFNRSRYAFVNPGLVHFVKSLEATFSKEALEEYLLRWIRLAIKNRETITYEELNCCSILTLRLDSRFQKIFRADPIMNKFLHKGINFDKFFDKEKIEIFMRLFEIGFERFAQDLPEVQTYESEQSLNLFSLFAIINPHLRKAIPLLKNEKDKAYLLSQFLNILMKQLVAKSNFITKSVVASTWNCMFTIEKSPRASLERLGKPRFRFLEKENMARNSFAFYHLTLKVMELPDQYKKDMGLDTKALRDVFSFYYDTLKTHLSQAQIQELESLFFEAVKTVKHPSPNPAAVTYLDTASVPVESMQAPGLLGVTSGVFSDLLDLLPALTRSSGFDTTDAGAAAAATVNLLAQGFNVLRLDSDEEL